MVLKLVNGLNASSCDKVSPAKNLRKANSETTATMSDPERALILEPGSPRPELEIAGILAQELGWHPADAAARLRYGGGILASGQETRVLESIGERLRALGVRARLVPARILGSPLRGYRAAAVSFEGQALGIRLLGGRELMVLEKDLRGIQIHGLRAETAGAESGRVEAPPAAAPLGAFPDSAISARASKLLDWIRESGEAPPQLVLTLYARDPIGPLRFERDRTDYSILGPEKMRHSLDNFLLFAERLLERYPALLNHERVRGFLDRLDLGELLYFKKEEAQNFDRWMQAWIRLEELGSPPISELP
jgi:hypothetical protein